MRAPIYGFANWVCRHVLLPPYVRMEVTGAENVPRAGPLVLACNHLNDADPAIIASHFPRRIVYLAKVELFKPPVLRQFMQLYGAVPVRRNEADLSALRRSAEALSAGLTVGIFPEGTRSGPAASLAQAWPGAALVALRAGAPVVPLAITGSEGLSLPWMFLHPLRRHTVRIAIGQPFFLERPVRLNAAAAQAGTQQIMERVAALLPPSYRGYYGNGVEAGGKQPSPQDAGAGD